MRGGAERGYIRIKDESTKMICVEYNTGIGRNVINEDDI